MILDKDIIKAGTRWSGSEHAAFVVINVVKLDDHVWVHYRKETDPAKEYSCYIESFIQRFRSLPN